MGPVREEKKGAWQNPAALHRGGRGFEPRWTSSAKQGIGSSLSDASRVSFTLSHGIFNEIYYPRVDRACTRDLGNDGGFGRRLLFRGEEKLRAPRSDARPRRSRLRAFQHVHGGALQDRQGSPHGSAQGDPSAAHHLHGAQGPVSSYRLYALLAPHIGNRGWNNTGWVGDYKGVGMIFAERDGTCMALACSCPWLNRSVGFVGFSDGWQDVSRNKRMTRTWELAENGNIALTAEVDLALSGGDFVIALGFGANASEAGNRALASLSDGFEQARREYIDEWTQWQEHLSLGEDSKPEERRDGSSDRFESARRLSAPMKRRTSPAE